MGPPEDQQTSVKITLYHFSTVSLHNTHVQALFIRPCVPKLLHDGQGTTKQSVGDIWRRTLIIRHHHLTESYSKNQKPDAYWTKVNTEVTCTHITTHCRWRPMASKQTAISYRGVTFVHCFHTCTVAWSIQWDVKPYSLTHCMVYTLESPKKCHYSVLL